jgi:hypothetical protein
MSEPHPNSEMPHTTIKVVRYSEKEESSGEPLQRLEEDGFLRFRDLMERLREKYPSRDYKSDEIVDRIKPTFDNGSHHLATYIASNGEQEVGAIIGVDSGAKYLGKWFVIDPEFQNTETAKNLLKEVQKDYDEVSILASTFGLSDDAGLDRLGVRQQALVRYYQSLGFEIDTSSESYRQDAQDFSPVPMIWRKMK